MVPARVFARLSNGVRAFASSTSAKHLLPASSRAISNEWVQQPMAPSTQYSFSRRGILQQFGLSSSASPQSNEKANEFKDARYVDKGDVSMNISEEQIDMESDSQSGYSKASDQVEHPEEQIDMELDSQSRYNKASDQGEHPEEQIDMESDSQSRYNKASDQGEHPDADTEDALSVDDLVKLVAEKEELIKVKNKEVEQMKDKVLRSYAEMENVIERTKREAENSKKFAIQSFAKSLLDVADNLGRASSVVKDSFSKVDQSKDSGATPLLKTLLEGVEMTDKQLTEVFRKFGVEKFDPINEQFDPNRHNAVFQVPDASKPAGTVAAVLKCGYVLYDRVIRPAEVGVTEAAASAEGVVESSEEEAGKA